MDFTENKLNYGVFPLSVSNHNDLRIDVWDFHNVLVSCKNMNVFFFCKIPSAILIIFIQKYISLNC